MINLVTGGAGFIGSYLIDNLIQKNEKVICLDNFLTGKVENIKRWYKNPNFKLINHDIINPIELDIKKYGILHAQPLLITINWIQSILQKLIS